jgi:Ca-activated chloride channel family protein
MNLEFQSPYLLLLLLAVPALLLWEVRRRGQASVPLSSADAAHAAPSTWRLRWRWLPRALRTLAIALLVLGLARPRSGQADALIPAEGIDMVIALDTSSSMRMSVGEQESRLAVAQKVLSDFIQGRENDRLALLAFREESFLLSPLTLDYRALQGMAERAGEVDLPDGTAIGLAVADSLNLLRDSTARGRVVILLTDGENNRREVEPLAAARIADALGIRLYAIGVIEERTVQPESASAERGNVDEEALKRMAEVTGGRYFRATSPQALADVYREIDRLERSRVGQEHFAAFEELAPYFLVPALALLALQVGLTATVFRRLP